MKLTLQLAALSIMNIGTAFLFQWYVFIEIGPGMQTDAFFAGMTVPNLILAVISGSLTHVLVPILAGENDQSRHHDAWAFVVLIGGLFTVVAVLLYTLAPWWIALTLPGFTPEGLDLTVRLTRIQLIGMVVTAISAVQMAVYHARHQFIWTELAPIISGLLAFPLLVWLLPSHGVIAAAWIYTGRMILLGLALAPVMGRPAWPDLHTPAVMTAWRRIKPLILGTSYYKTDQLVDRFLLSAASAGSISLFYLAQQLYTAASQVIGKALATPLVPRLSVLHKAKDQAGFKQVYLRKLAQTIGIALTGIVFIGLFGNAALSLLIGHGSVSADNVTELWWLMIWLAGVFVGGTGGQICANAFYASGNTMTPTRITVITYSLFLIVKVVSFQVAGMMGLALAASAYYLVNLSLLGLFFFKRHLR